MTRAVAKAPVASIAGYEIVERISARRQGAVYRARDPHTGEDVAIKVLSEQLTNDPVLRLRFAQECQIASRLRHPNIVYVREYGLEGAKPYLVMEYVRGESLADRLDREGRLPEAEAVAIITQIGQALHAAHERGLIHRDVTPDNILVTANGVAKLTDLGLVKNLDGDFNLTCTQSSLGAPNYIAPEQFEDAKRVDALCDLYSLAATLYAAITGELPFRARSNFALGAVYKKKLVNEITPVQQLVPELSEWVSAAIARALRADRKERQAGVLEFIEALAAPPAAPAPSATTPPDEPVTEACAEMPEPCSTPDQAPPDTQKNRRKQRRVSVRFGACCSTTERNPVARWRAFAIDISATGICLEVQRRFEPGAVLAIRMGDKKLARRVFLATVIWVKKRSARVWQLGCRHESTLSDEDLNSFT